MGGAGLALRAEPVMEGQTAIMSGYLNKCTRAGTKFSRWHRRYYVLYSNGVLYSFKNARSRSSNRVVYIGRFCLRMKFGVDAHTSYSTRCKLWPRNVSSNLCFSVVNIDRSFHFFSDSESDFSIWKSHLQSLLRSFTSKEAGEEEEENESGRDSYSKALNAGSCQSEFGSDNEERLSLASEDMPSTTGVEEVQDVYETWSTEQETEETIPTTSVALDASRPWAITCTDIELDQASQASSSDHAVKESGMADGRDTPNTKDAGADLLHKVNLEAKRELLDTQDADVSIEKESEHERAGPDAVQSSESEGDRPPERNDAKLHSEKSEKAGPDAAQSSHDLEEKEPSVENDAKLLLGYEKTDVQDLAPETKELFDVSMSIEKKINIWRNEEELSNRRNTTEKKSPIKGELSEKQDTKSCEENKNNDALLSTERRSSSQREAANALSQTAPWNQSLEAEESSNADERVEAAANWITQQLKQLISEIQRLGYSNEQNETVVQFGTLFDETVDTFDALSGILKTAKKHSIVHYPGEVLFQRMHDTVEIVLLKTQVEVDSSSFTTARPRGSKSLSREPSDTRIRKTSGFGNPTQFASNCKCFICNKTVYAMEFVSANEYVFHRKCFRCEQCQTPLTTTTYTTINDRFLCRTHYERLYLQSGGYEAFV